MHKEYLLTFFANTPDFQAPADYIGGIILAIIGAFGGLGFIVAAGCLIWILIQSKLAAAAGDIKKKKETTKNLMSVIITMIILGIAVPLAAVFATALMGKDMGLSGATKTFLLITEYAKISATNYILK